MIKIYLEYIQNIFNYFFFEFLNFIAYMYIIFHKTYKKWLPWGMIVWKNPSTQIHTFNLMQKKLPIENTNTHKNLEFKNLGEKPGQEGLKCSHCQDTSINDSTMLL
jgi:hypothetical protein